MSSFGYGTAHLTSSQVRSAVMVLAHSVKRPLCQAPHAIIGGRSPKTRQLCAALMVPCVPARPVPLLQSDPLKLIIDVSPRVGTAVVVPIRRPLPPTLSVTHLLNPGAESFTE